MKTRYVVVVIKSYEQLKVQRCAMYVVEIVKLKRGVFEKIRLKHAMELNKRHHSQLTLKSECNQSHTKYSLK